MMLNEKENLKAFISSNDYKNYERNIISEKSINNKILFSESLEEVFDILNIND